MKRTLSAYALLGALGSLALTGCLRPELPAEDCANTQDDDGDGFADCNDTDCAAADNCQGVENCGNGIDDDGNGAIDCADADCAEDPLCAGQEICDNGDDDDDDGAIDCADADCDSAVNCAPGDGSVGSSCAEDGDCVDNGAFCADETGTGFPAGYCTLFCDPTIANTGCSGDSQCFGIDANDPTAGACFDGCDDDADCRDGYECADVFGDASAFACLPACDSDAQCVETGFCDVGQGICDIIEICDNGVDDNGDGLTDCEDANCAATPECQQLIDEACAAALPTNNGDTITGDTSVDSTSLFDGSCQLGGASELMFSFAPPSANESILTLTLTSDADLGVFVRGTCADAGTELGCVDDNLGDGAVEVLEIITDSTDPLTIVVDGFAIGEEGPFTLTITTTEIICGDGLVFGNETCDDGNATAGDGCDAACQVEDGFVCVGEPSVCEIACGNGTLDLGETCDDGNVTAGDGCDAACLREDGFFCVGEPSVCLVTTPEVEPNDDGAVEPGGGSDGNDFSSDNANGPFSQDTIIEAALDPDGDEDVYEITNTGAGPVLVQLETFDDGAQISCNIDTVINLRDEAGVLLDQNDDGGLGLCSLLEFSLDPGETLFAHVVAFDDAGVVPLYFLSIDFTEIVCGDGIVLTVEECDDGNTNVGDGCDAACVVEDGFLCAGEPSVCDNLTGACDAAIPAAVGTNTGDTTGGTLLFDGSCQLGGAPEVLFSFTPTGNIPSVLTLTLTSDADLGVYVRENCVDDATELGCADLEFGAAAVETLTLPLPDPAAFVPLTIFVDGFAGGEEGPFTLVVAFDPILPEAECTNLIDEDFDNLFDCEDIDCANAGECTPGATATGGACVEASDCQANNNDPFCINEADFAFPNGACSEFCDLANDDCAGDASCQDIGLPSGNGICIDGCTVNADCEAGYICDDFDGDGQIESCLPQ